MLIKMSIIPGGKTGKVGKINVKTGDKVAAGDILVQIETAKGNRQIKAISEGTISKILCEEGMDIASNADMFEIAEDAEVKEAAITNCDSASQGTAKETTADLLIIGAGPGGYVAAIYAAKSGLKVTLVEQSALGGTCLNVGCIPTKALVKSAEVCHTVMNASVFGIESDSPVTVNMKQVIDRKDKIKDRLVSGIDFLMKKNEINVISGQASFMDKNTVTIKGEENHIIKAKNIIVATGSKISNIAIPGIELPFVLNSTKALSDSMLPKSITIIGGGVIGMEFAFIYKNFGVNVHVIEFMDRLLTMVDSDISKEIQDMAEENNIHIHTGSKVKKIQSSVDGMAVITYENNTGEHLVVSEKVLVAIGREPNLDGLSIEKSGVLLNSNGKGIQADHSMRTNVDNIYAIGDVTNIIQLAHVASHQGIVAIENILGMHKEMDYSAVPNVIFTSPEIASVGIGEDEAKSKDIDIDVSKFSFAGNGKALTMNEARGFIKLIKDKNTGKIIGGSIIGADASSLISSLTLAIANGFTEKEISETIFPHPTTSETIHEAALDFGIGALHQ
ncbi:dihydrolipoyl dehydrogenase [Lacrimispora sp.]|uniref:dihydrolipoyl dehydrogenase n=1 Tax=Lacrimispora sp. TaxID=2719234 RepID=UPI0028AEA07E|nr:dihydrolipoyl dehydrogenase [Lacrimispora sp.]